MENILGLSGPGHYNEVEVSLHLFASYFGANYGTILAP